VINPSLDSVQEPFLSLNCLVDKVYDMSGQPILPEHQHAICYANEGEHWQTHGYLTEGEADAIIREFQATGKITLSDGFEGETKVVDVEMVFRLHIDRMLFRHREVMELHVPEEEQL
jgi:hypothetical protein